MQLHTLIPRTTTKKVMIVGRGGKRGKTSGRGGKGQTARAGNKKRPELRDFIKRVPKLRGRGKNSHKTIETKPVVVNLEAIEKLFKKGDTVSPKTLIIARGIETYEGKIPQVKILGKGDITLALTFEKCKVSKEAQAKIEKAGGTVK
jgi:large subunit ribosomal protein L15